MEHNAIVEQKGVLPAPDLNANGKLQAPLKIATAERMSPLLALLISRQAS